MRHLTARSAKEFRQSVILASDSSTRAQATTNRYLVSPHGLAGRGICTKGLARALRFCALTALALSPASGALSAVPYKHVLIISVDGLHALDLANYVAAHPASTLASLAHTGIFIRTLCHRLLPTPFPAWSR